MCNAFNPEINSIHEVITKKCSITDAIQAINGLHVIQSSLDLDNANVEMLNEPDRLFRLREALQPVLSDYDYIIIDTPPAIETLTQMALCAADRLLIVAQASQFDIDAILQFSAIYNQIKSYFNGEISIIGILLTRFSERSNLRKEIRENMRQVAEQLGTSLFAVCIRENVAIPESQSRHVSIWKHDKRRNGAIDYHDFLIEFLERMGDEITVPDILKSEI
jgi:chromosome partitioning protein